MSEGALYTTLQASQKTGISLRQLQWWDETGWLVPERIKRQAGRGDARAYSETDMKRIAVIARLRECGIRTKPRGMLPLSGKYLRFRWLLLTRKAEVICASHYIEPVLRAAAESANSVVLVELPL